MPDVVSGPFLILEDQIHVGDVVDLKPLEILGENDFADSAIKIKIRIKTAPLKLWFVGREMRRRLGWFPKSWPASSGSSRSGNRLSTCADLASARSATSQTSARRNTITR